MEEGEGLPERALQSLRDEQVLINFFCVFIAIHCFVCC